MKSNEEQIVGLDLSLVSGMMVGLEFFEDDMFKYVIVDLFIIKFTYYKEKME